MILADSGVHYDRLSQGYHHVLTPAGTVAALVLALAVDYFSFGPSSWRDRLAWPLYFVAVAEAFGGSLAANRIFVALNRGIGPALEMTHTYIATAQPSVVAGMLCGLVAIYTVGVLAPSKAQRWLGKLATMSFGNPFGGGKAGGVGKAGGGSRLNPWVISSAAILGIMHPYMGGALGWLVRWTLAILAGPVNWAITWLFGGN
jgi:hypothetical protein